MAGIPPSKAQRTSLNRCVPLHPVVFVAVTGDLRLPRIQIRQEIDKDIMPELAESIAAIKESPREDRFTYLTILQYHVLSPEVLPTLKEVLEQDPRLTQEIGWDLVQMLLNIPESNACLETVARLGNPREVILKVMEALEGLSPTVTFEVEDDEAQAEGVEASTQSTNIESKFVVLMGMLAILHRRLKTKRPSAFLGASLAKVLVAYRPTPQMTASVINLVRSLSGTKRPPLPTRSSSIDVANPDREGDATKNAPDPEEELVHPSEQQTQEKLLRAFLTYILENYVNGSEMQWATRLMEHYYPKKVPPHKQSITQQFNEDETLLQRDAIVGQLAALARDLGFKQYKKSMLNGALSDAPRLDASSNFEDFMLSDDIQLSPGGLVSLVAYWLFSADVFEADSPRPDMQVFPELIRMLEHFLGGVAQEQINSFPGVADALLAIGYALHKRNQLSADGAVEAANFMKYNHYLTLISIFHPDVQVRNAATTFAGIIFHQDPDENNRMEILEDLFENCMFASLKACAVQWLKEEIIAANSAKKTEETSTAKSHFASSDAIDRLQYLIFPDSLGITQLPVEQFAVYWAQNGIYLLQVANFAFFLFSSGFAHLAPSGMAAAVDERFTQPHIKAAQKLVAEGNFSVEEKMELNVFVDRLQAIPTSKAV